MVAKRTISKDSKTCAALSYFLIGIVWFFVDEKMRNDSFVSFHVSQAIVFFLTGIAVGILNSILWIIPIIGMFLIGVLQLGLVVLFIFGLVQSISGKKEKLPVVGEYGEKFTF